VQSMVSKSKKAGISNVIVVNLPPSSGYKNSSTKIQQKINDFNSKYNIQIILKFFSFITITLRTI